MGEFIKRLRFCGCVALSTLFGMGEIVHAAKPIELSHEDVSSLQSLSSFWPHVEVKEMRRSVDFNKTLHIRIQQMYAGFPVWGADAVIHITRAKQKFMNGVFYQDLGEDLVKPPSALYSIKQKHKALQMTLEYYQLPLDQKFQDVLVQPIIFVDKVYKAHWAYEISFYLAGTASNPVPIQPHAIIDANSLHMYLTWNNIPSETKVYCPGGNKFGGGYGGNPKMGKVYYDGVISPLHLDRLKISRDEANQLCSLQNAFMSVRNVKTNEVISYVCPNVDEDHNEVYWNEDLGAANGGYSSSNDALYAGQIVNELYRKWYKLPPLIEADKPMLLKMVVHLQVANAFWDGKQNQMLFGDGSATYYPLTTLDIAAHEISHGFTQQHCNLVYINQSGGLNESFSDMAGQAALYYASHAVNWKIGDKIYKNLDRPIRWMDEPKRDGYSIDHLKAYHDGMNVHFSSGIFNKAFYLLATSPGWDTKRAFDIMVQANQNYWTSNTSFQQAACGVMFSAKDWGYPLVDVSAAFSQVGIDTSSC